MMSRGLLSAPQRFTLNRPSHRGALFICLLVFGLYVFRLDYKALWWDEGGSLYFARLSTAELLARTAGDVHPPLYLILLRGWADLAGWDPFAVRAPSVFAALLGLAMLYPLSRRLLAGQRRAALIVMLLSAALPMSLSRAQEARMYALAQLWIILAWYALLRLHQRQWAIVYMIAASLMLYTHYTTAFVLLAQGLSVFWLQPKWSQRGRAWVLQAVAAGTFLLWVIPFFASLTRVASTRISTTGTEVGVVTFIAHYWTLAVTGSLPLASTLSLFTAAGWGLMCVVAFGFALRRRAPGIGLAATWLLIPAACMWLAGRVYQYEGELTRPLLALNSPALAGCVVMGWRALPAGWARRAMAGSGFGLLVLLLPAWQAYYASSGDPEEDYRPLIADLAALARPGDAALTAYVWQDAYLASYSPELALALVRNEYSPETADDLASGILARHPRLWLINYRRDALDVADPLHRWLSDNASLVTDRWYGRSQLTLFVRRPQSMRAWPLRASFVSQITLDYQRDSITAQPGDVPTWTLRWMATKPIAQPLQVFVHLRTPAGSLIAQNDRAPANGLRPLGTWQSGEAIVDERALLIPIDAPPGDYFVYAGVYDAATGQRLALDQTGDCDLPDSVCLGRVKVKRR
jgi:hypothetical protein